MIKEEEFMDIIAILLFFSPQIYHGSIKKDILKLLHLFLDEHLNHASRAKHLTKKPIFNNFGKIPNGHQNYH